MDWIHYSLLKEAKDKLESFLVESLGKKVVKKDFMVGEFCLTLMFT